jgi:uncharacterized membrane protein YeaQ/YmgE (transglycosylase-associated protein family)
MNVVSWIFFGLIAGGLAKLIMPGKDPGGCLVTIALGMLGALVGGYIARNWLGYGDITGFNLPSLGIAIVGAILLLGLYRIFLGRRRSR